MQDGMARLVKSYVVGRINPLAESFAADNFTFTEAGGTCCVWC